MAAVYDTPKGGLYGGPFDSSGLDPNVRAILMDYRWTTAYGGDTPATQANFSFPQSAQDYLVVPGYPAVEEVAEFSPMNEYEQAATRIAFNLVASYTLLEFTEIASGLATNSTFRLARDISVSVSNFPPNEGTYDKSDSRAAGDTFIGEDNGWILPAEPGEETVFFGTDQFTTIMHEMGHGFGLKHGHDPSFNGKLSADRDDVEFSIMTYAAYIGADVGGAEPAHVGSSAQSYMMYDIAALQAYYGADFTALGDERTYTWNNSTGQQYINGDEAENTGTTATGKIFSTVWTQGATTTYDLSNFDDDQVDDLRAGQWLRFSKAQIADLNMNAAPGTAAYNNLANGNIYNTLLYNGDTRSLISNLVTGAGDDQIIGNELNNILTANDGNDALNGGGGVDVLYAGDGNDSLAGGISTGGINQLWGGEGTDTVTYADQTVVVYVDLGAGAGYVKEDGVLVLADALDSIENATGGSSNDTLIGDDGVNVLNGGAGQNALYGLDGDDLFAGGTATGGTNQLWGGEGTNTVDYSDVASAVRVDLGAGAGYVLRGSVFVLVDQMDNIQNAIGGAGDDRLIGDDSDNRLDGGLGQNALYGLDGDDVFIGGLAAALPKNTEPQGVDTNQLWGGAGSNTVDYSAQERSVYVDLMQQLGYVWFKGVLTLTDQMNSIQNAFGGSVADTLIGSGGSNYFEGLGGADRLYAGGGVVTFGYRSYEDSNLKTGYDTIVDFILGTDKIDLTALNKDFEHVWIENAGTSHSVYVVQTPGEFNILTDLAISISSTVAGQLTEQDFIF
ncbi:M10 family metallopeptidase C-terminal domain-containing protein [Reyranella aquatilis]|uniref:M10 family metallopeptidase C-terminal domain-containing protein n=1 Tax=Reyranella aquatilis TaxID=2035356 RepID=A0ABS8L266_9HYPH|nr:M10 family metallopeptidase C-terminal domain-containing protein [Reyranella aquatilis]MCC8432445.1 M10 family metallopeptidase C-terminal domain-containing protein [Reyranella aquatilis]